MNGAQGLGKCVGLGFTLEKKIEFKSNINETKSYIFQWLQLFPYCSLLWASDI